MATDPRALEEKAQKTLASASGGFSFFSGSREDKLRDAAQQFVDAANAYRMDGNNRAAGSAFERAARTYRERLNEPDDAAHNMVEAFKAYRKDSPEDAVRCLGSAIGNYTAKGNFRRAAGYKENEGELLENELGDRRRAMESYEKAAQWYEGDGATALANKLWLKVADIAALGGDYHRAIQNYEKVADQSLGNALMKYSVKTYFFKAGLCILATGDLVSARRNVERYGEKDPTFTAQREYQLLSDLVEAVEAGNQDAFKDKLQAYDRLSRLDKWEMELLLKIKNQIEEADNEFS